MERFLLSVAISLLLLSACQAERPVVTNPASTTTVPGFSEALPRLATQTQVAALTATADSQRIAPTLEIMTAFTPSPLPSLPSPLDIVGPFQQVSHKAAPIAGKVINLQTDQDGTLYLLSEGGYARFDDNQWTAYFVGETGYLVGVDPYGRGWTATYDGTYISRWDHRSEDIEIWIAYLEKEGWVAPESANGMPVSPGIWMDGGGNLWVATTTDVRRFNNERWEAFGVQALGMQPIAEASYASFTIYPQPGTSRVFVGRCDWSNMVPIGGGGLRLFDGNVWITPEAAFVSGCVTAIAQDASGSLWVAQDANLFRYNPTDQSTESIPMPAPPPQTPIGYIAALTADPDGSLWAQFALCNAESCLDGTALYHLQGNQWHAVGNPSPAGGMRVLFDASGTPWLFAAGNISQIVENKPQEISGLNVLAATTDNAGKLWLVAQHVGPPTLWTLP